MANCVTCKANCARAGQHRVKTDCVSYVPKVYPKPHINYDNIISKSPEELAEWITSHKGAQRNCPYAVCRHYLPEDKTSCFKCWLDWLKQEA